MPRASVGAVDLEYEVVGDRHATPVLLIGGLGSQLISWDDEICALLATHGYCVIRYDNRDSGLSTALDEHGVPDLLGLALGGGSAPYDLGDLAADGVGLLDHLAIRRAHVIGLSMGGMVAQVLALDYPERVISVVGLLSGPPGRPAELPSEAVIRALLRVPSDSFEGRVAAAVELRRALAGPGARFDEREAAQRAARQIDRAHNPTGTMRQAAAVLATRNRLADLPGLTRPVLLVHGENDPLVPFAAAQEAAQAIPGARFVGLPGLGHDLPAAVALQVLERIVEFHAELGAVATQP